MLSELEPHWKSVIVDEAREAAIVDTEAFDWLGFLSDPGVPFDERLDRWDAFALRFPQTELPLEHIFTEGLYTRKIFMPEGTIVTSRKHKESHPFVILTGSVSVISETEGAVQYEGPFIGVTSPGTRRALYVHTDTEWVTFHRNPENLSDPDALVGELTFEYRNPYLSQGQLEDLKR